MSFVVALDASNASLGGKARSLVRLGARGFATPPGFVITDAVFRAVCPAVGLPERFDQAAWDELERLRRAIAIAPWPRGFPEQLQSELRRVGGERFSVRSSFAAEDVAGSLAAGVYESCVDLPGAEVQAAVRRVLASAVSPGAAAYAMAHGRRPGDAPVAVLVHRYVTGEAEGSAAFAPEASSAPEIMVRRGSLCASHEAELVTALRKLAGELGPVEIEWVVGAEGLVYLQLRPFQPKASPALWQGFGELSDPEVERSRWQWDAAHNPLPLSPAQAGLVEFVDQRCRIGIRQRVLGGYLFYAPDPRPLPTAIDPMEAGRYFENLRDDFETRAAALDPNAPLEEALSLFASLYERIFGVLQPALKRRRRELRDFLATFAPAQMALLPALCRGVESVASERRRRAAAIRKAKSEAEGLQARAHYLGLFGDEAPVWDVSVPTYAEDVSPLLLDRREERADPSADWESTDREVTERLPDAERAAWRRLLGSAREAISLSEADDWLYARTQALVRRSLLYMGAGLARRGQLADANDVFFLPLGVVRTLGQPAVSSVDLLAIAAAGRTSWEAARKAPPPAAFSGDHKAVRGHGTGGHAIGRIVLHRSGTAPSVPADAVLLAQTLLPTELPLVTAAAIVTETGGPLDHVAAQARERGIPAVIGATGAGRLLDPGDLVLVDGESGLVVKLAGA